MSEKSYPHSNEEIRAIQALQCGCGEVWRQVVGWPEYEVSNYGFVRRVGKAFGARVGARLAKHVGSHGYFVVSLSRPGQRKVDALVHRLVVMAFIGDPGTFDVCHGDGNKLNCCVGNLRIDTRKGNMADQVAFGLTPRGERCGTNKYPQDLVLALRNRMDAGENVRAMSRETGVPATTLYGIKSRANWGWL